MLPMLRDGDAPETHDVQYFEMFGNRGIYHQGWTAVTKHRTPWKADTPPPFDDDVWELYGPDDWTQARNLVAENPEKLAELQRLWLIEAVKYNVVPLDDRGFERINPDIAGRPQLIRGNTQLLFDGMRVSEACVLTLKNKSHSVTANLVVPESGANGVIVTQGGSVGGWSLYAHEGKLKYCYNFFGIEHYITSADKPIPAGKHQVRMEFNYDGGGLAKGGDVTLYYDGKSVGTGTRRADPADGVLRRRGLRRRRGHRLARLTGLRPDRQQVHRRDRVGADRYRRRQPRPPDHAGGTVQYRHGAAITLAAGPARLNEQAFGLDGDALVVGEVTDSEGLDTFGPHDSGLRVQVAEPRGPHVAQADGAGESWVNAIAGCFTEHVVQHHRADSPVHVAGWTLVGGAEIEVGEHTAVRIVLDHQRRRNRITDSDDGVAPRHPVPTRGVADTEGAVELLASQASSGRIDLGLRGGNRLGVNLRPDRRVHQLPDRLGERLVEVSQPLDVGGTQVLDVGEVQHT